MNLNSAEKVKMLFDITNKAEKFGSFIYFKNYTNYDYKERMGIYKLIHDDIVYKENSLFSEEKSVLYPGSIIIVGEEPKFKLEICEKESCTILSDNKLNK